MKAEATRVERLKLRDFRCFQEVQIEPSPRMTLLVGANAQGKTSLLEACCVLVRLQSPRSSRLAHLIRHGARGFVVDGYGGGHHLQFYYSPERRKLALDSVPQTSARDYLEVGRVVYFSNEDIRLVGDGGSIRRRFLDFAGMQLSATYRPTLRHYERALFSRNRLLKLGSTASQREISAFTEQFLEYGYKLTMLRRALVDRLAPAASQAHAMIAGGGGRELPSIRYVPGGGDDLAAALAESREAERQAGQTLVGPHRDELELYLQGRRAADFASEGQIRTLVLALRLAVAEMIREALGGCSPVYLIDDVFGELDKARRNTLFSAIPPDAQMIVTTTHVDWLSDEFRGALVIEINDGQARSRKHGPID